MRRSAEKSVALKTTRAFDETRFDQRLKASDHSTTAGSTPSCFLSLFRAPFVFVFLSLCVYTLSKKSPEEEKEAAAAAEEEERQRRRRRRRCPLARRRRRRPFFFFFFVRRSGACAPCDSRSMALCRRVSPSSSSLPRRGGKKWEKTLLRPSQSNTKNQPARSYNVLILLLNRGSKGNPGIPKALACYTHHTHTQSEIERLPERSRERETGDEEEQEQKRKAALICFLSNDTWLWKWGKQNSKGEWKTRAFKRGERSKGARAQEKEREKQFPFFLPPFSHARAKNLFFLAALSRSFPASLDPLPSSSSRPENHKQQQKNTL